VHRKGEKEEVMPFSRKGEQLWLLQMRKARRKKPGKRRG